MAVCESTRSVTPPDLTALHQALARAVLGGCALSEVLAEIAGIARRSMPGSEASSITLIRGEKARSSLSVPLPFRV